MKLECLFCKSAQDIPLEPGFVCHCSCGTYGVICHRKDMDNFRKKAADFFGLASPYEVIYNYQVIFFSKNPLIILWMKSDSKQSKSMKKTQNEND